MGLITEIFVVMVVVLVVGTSVVGCENKSWSVEGNVIEIVTDAGALNGREILIQTDVERYVVVNKTCIVGDSVVVKFFSVNKHLKGLLTTTAEPILKGKL